ncbi:hypothetical protein FJ987_09185 [Mesorhizobium sp. CU2]|uniref:hypothetical protein n=1 Tax=unclassified Mesorhizobium TaxID=325217 RepID=UPI0011279B2F|nr:MULTISPECIES: hypothetical protein [unclassified Mesorhizobium]TPN81907.1 hypothetical protein FJ988_17065 [Mesorhizobium sp. CU3]TPO17324.1 hypothetical protein FJ987_09185 [Mesorhizobium sp. CU2]
MLLMFILLFLFVPFFAAAIMPNGIWLAVCAALMTAGIGYLWVDSSFDGNAGFMGILLLLELAIGASAGVLARGIGLWLRSVGESTVIVQAPVLIAFLLLAGGFSRLFVIRPKLDARPASQACLASMLHVSIGRSLFATPPVPAMQIRNGYQTNYALNRAKGTRSVCDATDNGSFPLVASSFSLSFTGPASRGGPGSAQEAFCTARKQTGWAAEWCDAVDADGLADWPEMLGIGLSSDDELRRVFLVNGPPRNELAEGLAKAVSEGRSIAPQPVAGFDRYTMPWKTEYWVSTDPKWLLPDNGRYMMNCSGDWCRVAFSIGNGLFAGYSFHSPVEGREAKSRAVYSKALSLVDQLRASP